MPTFNIITDAVEAAEPLDLTLVKSQLRVDISTDDTYLKFMISAARGLAESAVGRELAVKTWELSLDAFPSVGIRNPPAIANPMGYGFGPSAYPLAAIELKDPLVSVSSVIYTTADGTPHTMAANTDYLVDTSKHPGIVIPPVNGTWPADQLVPSSGIRVRFIAGYAPTAVKASWKQAMLLLITQWYEHRIPFAEIRFVAENPYSVSHLFNHEKLWRF